MFLNIDKQDKVSVALIDNEGKPLNKSYAYDEDVAKYVDFLQTGLRNYQNK